MDVPGKGEVERDSQDGQMPLPIRELPWYRDILDPKQTIPWAGWGKFDVQQSAHN